MGEASSLSPPIQSSLLWLARGKNTDEHMQKLSVLIFSPRCPLDNLINKIRSHYKLINHPKWVEKIKDFHGTRSPRKWKKWRPTAMVFSCENRTSFIGIRKSQLCSALLLVKWRKLIELYSSHKGNCFWVNDCFRQGCRQAERHKQVSSLRDTCTNSQKQTNCK